MKKFQVTIHFEMDDEFMKHVPEHRALINKLIEDGVIDHYVVTMESQRAWVTLSAANKEEVENYLRRSPIHKYWTYEIEELFLIDGQHYRLPALQMN